MKTSAFLPYTLSKLAKDKGFNEPCMSWFCDNDHFQQFLQYPAKIKNSDHRGIETAPLYQEIEEWLFKNYGINVRRGDNDVWELKSDAWLKEDFTTWPTREVAIESALKMI